MKTESLKRSFAALVWGVLPLALCAGTLPPENAFTSFGNDTFASPDALEADLKLVDGLADAGYDVITHTLRCRPDLNSPETKAAVKRFIERAHARGLKVYMDTDPRIARHAYLEKNPDQKQGVLRFGVVAATNGTARIEIVQKPTSDHMAWGSKRPYEPVAAACERAWAIRTAADGSVTARPIAARATDVRGDRITVSADGLADGESLAALVRFDLWSIDVFSPGLPAYARALMAEYKALGADGGMRDEWGFPPSVIAGVREHRTFWYSQNYADAYARATGGRKLLEDALLLAFPLAGRAAERSRAVLDYMRLNWERNTALERDFYETDKRLFGPDVYVCKHPTWYSVIGWCEFLHHGLDWWSAPRDWAQSDEAAPLAAVCGMAKKFGGATWMNEGYQDTPDRYAPMVWRYALAGGRMVFHPVYPDTKKVYKKLPPAEAKIARHLDIVKDSKRARECVRLLSRISSAPIDSPVAYVFGHGRVAWDWTDPAYGDWGEGEVLSLWKLGWCVDLYPSTEFASFSVGADGFLRMGAQRYAALVTHNLSDADRAALKALLAKGVSKTRVFESVRGVAEYLASVKGLARQTPPAAARVQGCSGDYAWDDDRGDLPPPDGTITLTDGTRARIRAIESHEGDPIQGVLELADGRRYEYAARGLFAANAKFVAGAGATRIKGPGVDFTSATPRDVVLPLASSAAQGEIVIKDGDAIAFMGDSITEYGNRPVGYVNLVMKGLEVAGVKDAKKIPAGVAGHKSNNMRGRLQRDVLARRDKKRAQWMTLSCGVNDVWHQIDGRGVLLPDYQTNVCAMLDACAASNVNVIVLTPTMIKEDEKGRFNVLLAPYVAWLKEEAARRKLPCADLNAVMREEVAKAHAAGVKGYALTSDGVHMAYEGNKMMAWAILRTMGVPAEMKDACVAAWDRMPGYAELKVPLSKVEQAEFRKRAESEKAAEGDLARKLIGFK